VLEMVKTFEEWFEFINDGDLANLVDLVKNFNSVLNKLSKVHSRLDGVGDTLDDNGIISSFVKELPCSLPVVIFRSIRNFKILAILAAAIISFIDYFL
jgi:hypothetical protein